MLRGDRRGARRPFSGNGKKEKKGSLWPDGQTDKGPGKKERAGQGAGTAFLIFRFCEAGLGLGSSRVAAGGSSRPAGGPDTSGRVDAKV